MSNTLGTRIRKLRNQKKLSQKEFGKLFMLAESTIGMYERDERKPDYEILEKIADHFGVSINYMFGRADKAISTVTVAGQEISLSIEELQLFEELKRHPALFHDLATDPKRKIKELLKLYEMKKMLLEEDTSDYGEGFGELKD